MEASMEIFFTSPQFAVVGASSDPTKYGHKVFAWYITHSLPATPINPRAPSILLSQPEEKTYPTVPSVSDLSLPGETSVSIITPPTVTMEVLKEAREKGVRRVWMQPGSFDKEVLGFARDEFETAVGGNGECVLANGEGALRGAGREGEKL